MKHSIDRLNGGKSSSTNNKLASEMVIKHSGCCIIRSDAHLQSWLQSLRLASLRGTVGGKENRMWSHSDYKRSFLFMFEHCNAAFLSFADVLFCMFCANSMQNSRHDSMNIDPHFCPLNILMKQNPANQQCKHKWCFSFSCEYSFERKYKKKWWM